jgi:hypothetical protein
MGSCVEDEALVGGGAESKSTTARALQYRPRARAPPSPAPVRPSPPAEKMDRKFREVSAPLPPHSPESNVNGLDTGPHVWAADPTNDHLGLGLN